MAAEQPHTTEVDGVPVFWADMPGPLRAGLVFRTGLVDEPLPRAGWTHLAEHLALAPLGLRPHTNGTVGLTATTFDVSGSPEDVTAFFDTVCGSIRALPTERFDLERNVLAAEAANSGPGLADWLLLLRFGRDGYGATNRKEYGLDAATPEAVAEWARSRFVIGAAALWLTGPPPAGLSLRLPEGERTPLPEVRPLIPRAPYYVVEDTDAVAASLVVRGDVAVPVFVRVLRERLMRRLRLEAGVAYAVRTGAARLRDDLMHVVASVDSAPGQDAVVAHGVLAELDALAASGPTAEELAAALPEPDDDSDAGRLYATAGAAAAGRPLPPPLAAWHTLVTPQTVAAVASEALAQPLLALRAPDEVVAARCAALPVWSPALPGGTVLYRGDDERRKRRVVVTDRGVGLHVGADQFVTVPWPEVSGVLAWEDGTRQVLGTDGSVVHLDPADLPESAGLPTLVDRYAGAARIVPQRPRETTGRTRGTADVAADTAKWEREFANRKRTLRGLRSEAMTNVALVVAILLGMLAAVALLLFVLVKAVGAGVLGAAVPALVAFLFVSYREYRKEKP